jgi:hypothetical protein
LGRLPWHKGGVLVSPWLALWLLLRHLLLLQGPSTTFPVRVAVAIDEAGRPVASPAWLDEQMARAGELFGPYGVQFARQGAPALPPASSHLETRADRDALALRVAAHVVNVFIVASLQDVDEPGRPRRGVHWHAPSGAHYVIVVGSAPPTVLAHELGHFFGNPHSPVVDNVMSYERTGAPVFFDEAQGQRIEASAKRYLSSGELLPLR